MRIPPVVALVVVTLACGGGGEKPATDSAAAPAAAASTVGAPATEAEVAGTWTGTAKAAGSDSAFVHWTQVCANGACLGTTQESPDTARSTYRLAGDSVIGATAAYIDPAVSTSKVIDNWVLRAAAGKLTGHGWYVIADKPDSVVFRYTFEGVRK